MEITILQEKLKEGLNLLGKIAPRSSSLPALNNISAKTEKNFLVLSATDLEMAVHWWALAKIEEPGEIILPGQTTASLVGSLPNKPIKIKSKDLSLEIGCEGHRSFLKTFNPEEFPIIPEISKGDFIEIKTRPFLSGLNGVVGVCASSSSKPEISGVYFAFQPGEIKMAATDSFRLAEKILPLKEKKDSVYSFILPQRSAREIINLFAESGEAMKICFSPNQILFESMMAETSHPQLQFISRLVEGEFPDYQEILPKQFETQAVVSQKEILALVKTAGIFCGRNNEIKLKVDAVKNQVEISGQNQDIGEYQSQIPAKIKGKGLEVVFNHRFLMEGLSGAKEEVSFEFTGEEGPSLIKPAGEEGYLYVLMPIKKD